MVNFLQIITFDRRGGFNQINFILKLRFYSRHILLLFECCENPLAKGVNIFLRQPVWLRQWSVFSRSSKVKYIWFLYNFEIRFVTSLRVISYLYSINYVVYIIHIIYQSYLSLLHSLRQNMTLKITLKSPTTLKNLWNHTAWKALQKIITLQLSLLSHWNMSAIIIQEC